MKACTPLSTLLRLARARWVATQRHAGTRVRLGAAALALLLGGLVLIVGATPVAAGALGNGWDKAAHLALHFVLCHLLLFAFGLRRGALAVAACLAFAVLDEAIQQFSPGRTVSGADVLASGCGAVLALASAQALAWHNDLQAVRRAMRLRRLKALWLRMPR